MLPVGGEILLTLDVSGQVLSLFRQTVHGNQYVRSPNS
jgi:hypothetical protein